MKRKKWSEEEEQTLILSYSDHLSSTAMFSQLPTREKKFQPIAARLNSLHHSLNPSAFPFTWSWRDVSIKIQNMRHQYLNVKLKLPPDSPNSDLALTLWPNYFRYKAVFGDIDPDTSEDGELGKMGAELRRLVGRRRRSGIHELEGRERWRRREERRDEEEMEWRERMMGLQMEHEKRVVQMQVDACRAQAQVVGILVRVACQFMGSGASSETGGNDGGMEGIDMHNLQQQQVSAGSLVGDEGKNDEHSGEGYL